MNPPGVAMDVEARGAVLTGLMVFVAYLAFLPAVPYWLDAPEFMAAAWNLGQAHPPGHPAMLVLLKAFMFLPIGDAPFRANLFSAVFGAVGAGLVFILATHVVGSVSRSGASGRAAMLAGGAAALGFGLSGSSVIQAMSVEVYTFNSALVLGALVLAVRMPSDWKAGVVIAVLVGLGLGNHHLLTLLAVPALLIAFVRFDGISVSAAAVAVAVMLWTGSASYFYLWARDLAGAWPMWAGTSSFDGLAWFASARIFAGSIGGFEDPVSGIIGNSVKAAGLLAGVLGPASLPLCLGGAYVLARKGSVRMLVVLVVLVAAGLASKIFMGILDPSNPDDHGYFLTAVAGIAVMAASFGALVLDSATAKGGVAAIVLRWVGVVALLAFAVMPAFRGIPIAVERSGFDDTVTLGRMTLDDLPLRPVVFASHYPVFFLSQYRQVVEGARPDATVVQESLNRKARGGGGYARRLESMDGDLAKLVDGFLDSGSLDWRALLDLSASRAVLIEASEAWDGLSPAPGFAGWHMAVGRAGEVGRPLYESVTAHVERLREAVGGWRGADVETRRVVLRHLASSARMLGVQGQVDAAKVLLVAARDMNPLDRTLRTMSREFLGDDGVSR